MKGQPMPTLIKLPDFSGGWPFKPTLHPDCDTFCEESLKWVESYPDAFGAETLAEYRRDNAAYYGALVYPHHTPSVFRVACDIMNLILVFDEFTDRLSSASVHALSAVVKDALRDPTKPRPPGESVLGEMTKSCWSEALKLASPSSAQRFIKDLSAYMDATAEEAEDRDHGRVRSISEYIDVRRHTTACRPSFDLFLLTDDVPDCVVSHPSLERLALEVIDLTIFSNDVYSYDKEQVRGNEGHNLVSVVMHEKRLDLQGAIDYIGELFRELAVKFLEDMKHVPSFSESIDKLVADYVFHLHNWVAGNIEYHFASQRYFGTKNEEMRAKLVVELRPKISVNCDTP